MFNANSDRAKLKVLLVEDNEDQAEIIEELLLATSKGQKLSLNHVETLRAAQEILAQENFAVILLDLSLPDSYGIETVSSMQQYSCNTPIVVLTAQNDEELAVQVIQAGAQDYLIKTKIDRHLLIRSIRYAIERSRSQEALRQSEEKYRSVVENSLIGIAMIAPIEPENTEKFTWIQVNEPLCNLLGYNQEELMQKNWLDLSHPEEYKINLDHLQQILTGVSDGYVLDKKWLRKDGKIVYVRVAMRPVYNRFGKIDRLVAIVLNISDRYQYETQLKASEKFLINTLNAIADPVFAKDENHRFLIVNDAFCHFVGISRENLIGRSDYDFFPPEQAKIFWEKDNLVFQSGLPNENEDILTDNDGNNHIISTKKTLLYTAKNQKILVATIRDITDYKQQQSALKDSEERLQKMADNVPGMLYQFYMTPEGKMYFSYISSVCRQIFEIEPEDITKNIELVFAGVHTDELEKFTESIINSARNMQPWHREWRHKSSSGKEKLLQGSSRPGKQPNGDIIWDGLVMDITELRQAQKERDRFFTISLDLLCIAGFDGYFKRLNPVCYKTLGYTETELLATPFIDFLHPEDRNIILIELKKLAQGIPSINIETRYQCKDGNYKWLAWNAVPFVEENLIYAVCRDITDRKKSEEILQKSEATNRALLNAIPDLILRCKSDGTFVDFKPANHIKTLVPPSEFLGKKIPEILPNDLSQQVIKIYTEALRTKEVQVLEYQLPSEGNIRDFEARIVPCEPEEIICIVRDITNRKQTEESLIQQLKREQLLVSMLERIRSYLNLEEVLSNAVEEVRNFLQIERTIIYRFNQDWSGVIAVESVKDNWLSIQGVIIQDKCFAENYISLYMEGRISALEDIDNSGLNPCYINLLKNFQVKSNLVVPILQYESDALNFNNITSDRLEKKNNNIPTRLWGLLIAHQCSEIRVWTSSEIESMRQVCVQLAIAIQQSTLFQQAQTEINERKLAEIALQKAKESVESASRAKREFLANMSHELRTPLNGILGYAQILKNNENLNQYQQQSLNTIQDCGEHLLTLINDVLDLSKIEARKMEICPHDFDFSKFIKTIADLFRMRALQKDIKFIYESLSILPNIVHGDEKRLRQVLINLLGNAVKFTEKGQVTFKVGIINQQNHHINNEYKIDSQKASSSHYPLSIMTIRFQVEDTGIGIPENKLTDIFLPFHQVGENINYTEGTGLGLSISQKLVNMMGSDIKVKSSLGEGSIFWMDLELPAVAKLSEIELIKKPTSIIGFTGNKRKILVVDDNKVNRTILKHLLSPLGFEIQEAIDGVDCLEKAVKFQPDAILLDLIMPVMDGFEVTRRLRQIPELKNVVLLVLSGSVFHSTHQKSILAGCDNFITKPIQASQILEMLQIHLQLDWIYADISSKPQPENTTDSLSVDCNDNDKASQAPPGEIISPSQEEIANLLKLAAIGDIEGLVDEINTLETNNNNLSPFFAQLRHLIKGFQMKKIREFLKQHLQVE